MQVLACSSNGYVQPQNMCSLDLRLTSIYRVHISLSVSSQFTLFDLHLDESPIIVIDRKVYEILCVFLPSHIIIPGAYLVEQCLQGIVYILFYQFISKFLVIFFFKLKTHYFRKRNIDLTFFIIRIATCRHCMNAIYPRHTIDTFLVSINFIQ